MIGRPTRSSGSPRGLDANQARLVPCHMRPLRLAMAWPADRVGTQSEVL